MALAESTAMTRIRRGVVHAAAGQERRRAEAEADEGAPRGPVVLVIRAIRASFSVEADFMVKRAVTR